MKKYSKLIQTFISIICISFVLFHLIVYQYRVFWIRFFNHQFSIYPPEDVPGWVFDLHRLLNYDYELLMIIFLLIFSVVLIKKDKINITFICINILSILMVFVCHIIYDNTITITYYPYACVYYINIFHSIACALIIGEMFYIFKEGKIKIIYPYIKLIFFLTMIVIFIYRHIDNNSRYDFVFYHNAITFSILELFGIVIFKKEKNTMYLSVFELAISVIVFASITFIKEKYYYDTNFVNQYVGLGLKIYVLRSIWIYGLIILYLIRQILWYKKKKMIMT